MDDLQYKIEAMSWIDEELGFKPCYKWMTFNTEVGSYYVRPLERVLNLVING